MVASTTWLDHLHDNILNTFCFYIIIFNKSNDLRIENGHYLTHMSSSLALLLKTLIFYLVLTIKGHWITMVLNPQNFLPTDQLS